MIDLRGKELKDAHELANDWTGQTVQRRFEDAIRLLKIHGILSGAHAKYAKARLELMLESDGTWASNIPLEPPA